MRLSTMFLMQPGQYFARTNYVLQSQVPLSEFPHVSRYVYPLTVCTNDDGVCILLLQDENIHRARHRGLSSITFHS